MRVYVVDRDAFSSETLARLVRGVGHEPEIFADAEAFFAAAAEDRYGCVLLDVQLPGQRGLDILAWLAAQTPAWPVIMVSATTDVEHAIAAFRYGALHFLRKPYVWTELEHLLGEAVGVAHARLADHRRSAQLPAVRLSPREREVLRALAEGQQSKMIAWQLGLSVRTIDMHRSNILAKLDARNASQAVAIARDLNLLDAA